MTNYSLVFDEVIIKQLKKVATKSDIKDILSKMFDKLETNGCENAKLIDPKLNLYELKLHNPPLRLYFRIIEETKEIFIFEFEMKTSEKKQKQTIQKISKKLKK